MVVNNELPVGLVANTTAVLGISLGNNKTDIIGPDCTDGTNIIHKGITKATVPILGTTAEQLKSIYQKSIQNQKVDVIDFNRIAQGCRDYSDYTNKLLKTSNQEIEYSGVCLSGPKKEIDKMRGSLGLYR